MRHAPAHLLSSHRIARRGITHFEDIRGDVAVTTPEEGRAIRRLLDRGIVARAPTDPNARAVLLAMATFARQTGAYIIAEGIEDAELLGYVRAIDEQVARAAGAMVQGGQGYGLGRPSPELPLPGSSLEALEPA